MTSPEEIQNLAYEVLEKEAGNLSDNEIKEFFFSEWIYYKNIQVGDDEIYSINEDLPSLLHEPFVIWGKDELGFLATSRFSKVTFIYSYEFDKENNDSKTIDIHWTLSFWQFKSIHEALSVFSYVEFMPWLFKVYGPIKRNFTYAPLDNLKFTSIFDYEHAIEIGKLVDKKVKYFEFKTYELQYSNLKKNDRFRNDFFFLSNYFQADIIYQSIKYNSSEIAYKVAKTYDTNIRYKISQMSFEEALEAAKEIIPYPNWDNNKVEVMTEILRCKFFQNKTLMLKLIATRNIPLEEGNEHGDIFWGTVNGVGENNLGKILMKIRVEFQKLPEVQEFLTFELINEAEFNIYQKIKEYEEYEIKGWQGK